MRLGLGMGISETCGSGGGRGLVDLLIERVTRDGSARYLFREIQRFGIDINTPPWSVSKNTPLHRNHDAMK